MMPEKGTFTILLLQSAIQSPAPHQIRKPTFTHMYCSQNDGTSSKYISIMCLFYSQKGREKNIIFLTSLFLLTLLLEYSSPLSIFSPFPTFIYLLLKTENTDFLFPPQNTESESFLSSLSLCFFNISFSSSFSFSPLLDLYTIDTHKKICTSKVCICMVLHTVHF